MTLHRLTPSPRLLATCFLLAGTAGALWPHQLEGPRHPAGASGAAGEPGGHARRPRAVGDAAPPDGAGPFRREQVEPLAPGGAGTGEAPPVTAPTGVSMPAAGRPDETPAAGEEGFVEPAKLAITGYRVNVRAGPGTDAPVVTQLDAGEELIEAGRHGDWVRIATAGPSPREGWVHGSFVRPMGSAAQASGSAAAVAAAPVAIGGRVAEVCAAGMTAGGRLDLFRALVEQVINEPVRRVARVGAFTGVADLGGGVVRLTALPAWFAMPGPARRAELTTLVRLWAALHEPDQAVAVRIVDGDGNVAMERRR